MIEGFVDVGPGRIWYEETGSGASVLLLHGGPGAASDYLRPLFSLAEDGYRVVRYDQLGCGRADRPDDVSLWNVDRFREEVEIVRQALSMDHVHLIGQSWGSFLALDYALHYPENLRSLTLYSGAASTHQCFNGMNELRAQLPAETIQLLDHYEAIGETSHPEYLAAIDILLKRHLCRLDPWPAELTQDMNSLAMPVYETMWGANEFTCTGTLLDWNVTNQLAGLKVPTLILCGRYDEVVPGCSETMHEGITGAELVIFENCSHLAHFEDPDAFYGVLRPFLAQHTA